MLEELSKRSSPVGGGTAAVCRYLELDNVGHCPNHEAPKAVGSVVTTWIGAKNRHAQHLTLVDDDNDSNNNVYREDWAEIRIQERSAAEIRVGLMDRLATTFIK